MAAAVAARRQLFKFMLDGLAAGQLGERVRQGLAHRLGGPGGHEQSYGGAPACTPCTRGGANAADGFGLASGNGLSLVDGQVLQHGIAIAVGNVLV